MIEFVATVNNKFDKFSSDVHDSTVPLHSRVDELSSELEILKIHKDK